MEQDQRLFLNKAFNNIIRIATDMNCFILDTKTISESNNISIELEITFQPEYNFETRTLIIEPKMAEWDQPRFIKHFLNEKG